MPGNNVLPRDPTSIASVAALLANSNLFDFLPRGAEHMSSKEIKQSFASTTSFELGYVPVVGRTQEPGHDKERFMVHVLEDREC